MNIPGMSDMGNIGGTVDKLKDKIHFPAMKSDIANAADGIPEIPAPVKNMIKEKLPDKKYGSIQDVKNAIGIK